MRVFDEDRERVKAWMANGGLADPIESLALEFAKLREELAQAHMPASCNNCRRRIYYGERVGSVKGALYCNYECAEEAGEEWAWK
jgi:hypothetical protein